jgi:glutathione synthase/RimK-type ligase-like ATP-grasp enzyme
MTYDIVLLSADKFLAPNREANPYFSNVILEDGLVKEALEKEGFTTKIVSWSDRHFDFSKTKAVLVRTIWDYFERFVEFSRWLEEIKTKTVLINSYETIRWNMDKHYLLDLEKAGINIPQSLFFKQGKEIDFETVFSTLNVSEIVVKPTISGAAYQTFRLSSVSGNKTKDTINALLQEKDFIVQPFIESIVSFGEISIMLIGGQYTHAVLKKAKRGDYRVQDDHGGTVEPFEPTAKQIAFAKQAYDACNPKPLYARVDIVVDNENQLAVSELELIEPEFWYRFHQPAAEELARQLKNTLS